MVRIQLYQQDADYVSDPTYEGNSRRIPTLSDETYSQILELPDVEGASVYNRRQNYNNSFYYGNTELSGCEVYGIDNTYFSTCGYKVKRGRSFVPKDFQDFRPIAVIDSNTAKLLFQGEEPIGKTIEYDSIALVVIGVVEEDSKFEPVINTLEDYFTYAQSNSAGKSFPPQQYLAHVLFLRRASRSRGTRRKHRSHVHCGEKCCRPDECHEHEWEYCL